MMYILYIYISSMDVRNTELSLLSGEFANLTLLAQSCDLSSGALLQCAQLLISSFGGFQK